MEDDATLGPFARLRRGSRIGPGAEIGNFIEIKQATIGRRVKAHHVGYIGDATVGEGANIGAGTVTCNYDGLRKHQTRIGARAFVGTNSSLVAPAHDRRRRVRGRGVRDHPGRARRRAGRRAGAAGRQGGLDGAAPGPPPGGSSAPARSRPDLGRPSGRRRRRMARGETRRGASGLRGGNSPPATPGQPARRPPRPRGGAGRSRRLARGLLTWPRLRQQGQTTFRAR